MHHYHSDDILMTADTTLLWVLKRRLSYRQSWILKIQRVFRNDLSTRCEIVQIIIR